MGICQELRTCLLEGFSYGSELESWRKDLATYLGM